nr:immunoglobulin light chain junction region [Macaca mulatta]MOV75174.1 immunoglobulin light chain junction region [Macaca mulatta]MOV75561.1 immunoglobulin light chain junction region [Macaca mulatta]
CQAYITSPFTF